jgi:hypothetical protein
MSTPSVLPETSRYGEGMTSRFAAPLTAGQIHRGPMASRCDQASEIPLDHNLERRDDLDEKQASPSGEDRPGLEDEDKNPVTRRMLASHYENPVTIRMLREHFGDGKWRPASSMANTLDRFIDNAFAAREIGDSPRYMKLALSDRLRAGKQRFVAQTMKRAMKLGIFESRKARYESIRRTEYRYCLGDDADTPVTVQSNPEEVDSSEVQHPEESAAAVPPGDPSEPDAGPITTPRKVTTRQGTGREARAAAKASTERARAEEVHDLVRRIRIHQDEIRANERKNIPILVEIGVLLIELKREARRDWGKRARDLGYHPREASRYLKLGARWGDQIRTIGSENLESLPAEIKMLEQICQLPPERLGDFVARKKATEKEEEQKWDRKRVAHEVQAFLGEPCTPPRPVTPDRIVQSFGRAVSRTVTALKRLDVGAARSPDVQHRLRAILDEAFDDPEDTPGQ